MDGKSYSFSCGDGGFFLSEKILLFKSGPKKKLGPGGYNNFVAWRTKLKAQVHK